ncbi:hypothetical protein H5410_053015 [Solanum commersonii]|uniref:Uncharacterized protein n=1 Tax=Solanum commersonii TaxID=4109 RepID=A0A9J5X523_SOLCO|nr:hypothetical protein H5410_053015 [Solanum commersonii]
MEPVDPDGQNGSFSRSNKPQSSSSFLVIRNSNVILPKFSWTFVKTLAMEPVDSYGKNDLFSRSNDPQSR